MSEFDVLDALRDGVKHAESVLPKVKDVRRGLILANNPAASATFADIAAAEHLFLAAVVQLGVAVGLLEGYADSGIEDGET